MVRSLFGVLLLGCAQPASAEPAAAPAPQAEPDCREIIGGTGGAHPIRTVCPELDRRLAEMGRTALRNGRIAGADCPEGMAHVRNGGNVDRLSDYVCAEPPAPELVALMDRIERNVVLPPAAPHLGGYGRYYAWDERAPPRSRVIGVYVSIGGWPSGRHWVDQAILPRIFDGGCGLVTLIYDVARARIESMRCNGLA